MENNFPDFPPLFRLLLSNEMDEAMATENHLYQARLIIVCLLYRELLNRYGLALTQIHVLSEGAKSLLEETDISGLSALSLTLLIEVITASNINGIELLLPEKTASLRTLIMRSEEMYKIELCSKWQETSAQCQFAHGLSDSELPRYRFLGKLKGLAHGLSEC
ncbi:hypothetical protein Dimus_027363 [Dionaea muscipula]